MVQHDKIVDKPALELLLFVLTQIEVCVKQTRANFFWLAIATIAAALSQVHGPVTHGPWLVSTELKSIEVIDAPAVQVLGNTLFELAPFAALLNF